MKKVTLIIIFLFSCLMLSAQSGFIKVSKGKVTEGDFFKSKLFILPDFTDARIKFTNGEIYEGKVNIHTLSQTLRFVDAQGDTLAAADEKLVESVSAGKVLFVKINNQYVQVIDTDGYTSLVISRTLHIGAERIEGAYGIKNDVSSIQKVEIKNFNSKIENVISDATLAFSYLDNLLLANRGKLFLVTKRNLQKFFPSQKAFIEEYYSKNNIKQENREEIITLFKQILSNNL